MILLLDAGLPEFDFDLALGAKALRIPRLVAKKNLDKFILGRFGIGIQCSKQITTAIDVRGLDPPKYTVGATGISVGPDSLRVTPRPRFSSVLRHSMISLERNSSSAPRKASKRELSHRRTFVSTIPGRPAECATWVAWA
jgi:hypothetical protein